jgi:hypothetical protein
LPSNGDNPAIIVAQNVGVDSIPAIVAVVAFVTTVSLIGGTFDAWQ